MVNINKCERCEGRSPRRTIVRSFCSEVLQFSVPKDLRNDLVNFYESEKESLLNDIISNPGKWLKGIESEKQNI